MKSVSVASMLALVASATAFAPLQQQQKCQVSHVGNKSGRIELVTIYKYIYINEMEMKA